MNGKRARRAGLALSGALLALVLPLLAASPAGAGQNGVDRFINCATYFQPGDYTWGTAPEPSGAWVVEWEWWNNTGGTNELPAGTWNPEPFRNPWMNAPPNIQPAPGNHAVSGHTFFPATAAAPGVIDVSWDIPGHGTAWANVDQQPDPVPLCTNIGVPVVHRWALPIIGGALLVGAGLVFSRRRNRAIPAEAV